MGNNNQKIGISQKAILFRDDGKILALKRTAEAPSRPLHWDLPGGELDYGENVKNGIIREVKEETGLEIKDIELVDVISGMDDKNEFWVTICYSAKLKTTNVILSYEHDDFRWIAPSEFQGLQASTRNKEFVKTFVF